MVEFDLRDPAVSVMLLGGLGIRVFEYGKAGERLGTAVGIIRGWREFELREPAGVLRAQGLECCGHVLHSCVAVMRSSHVSRPCAAVMCCCHVSRSCG